MHDNPRFNNYMLTSFHLANNNVHLTLVRTRHSSEYVCTDDDYGISGFNLECKYIIIDVNYRM